MFSWQHFVWIGISIALIIGLFFLFKKVIHVKLDTFLYISAAFVFIQEMIQMIGMMHFLPYAPGHPLHGQYAPYFEPKDFPLHLCSIQFITLFLAARQNDPKKRKKILAFFFPTAIFGAFMALLLSNVFTLNEPHDWWMTQCFISPVYYSFFLVHAYLLFAGIYIAVDEKDVDFHFKDCFSGIFAILMLGCGSLILNSAFAVVTRDEKGFLKEIVANANLFFTTDLPFDGLVLTKKWQWVVYFLILIALVFIVFMLFFLPYYIKDQKKEKSEKERNEKEINEKEKTALH